MDFTACMIAAIERPRAVNACSVAAAAAQLRVQGLSAGRYQQILSVLASVVYGRPDLIDGETVVGLHALLSGPPLPDAIYGEAGDLLNCLLTTPAATHAVEALLRLLSSPDRPAAVHAAMLRSLQFAAVWVVRRLDLATLTSLAECHHLIPHRELLLHEVIERVLFADPRALTTDLFRRLSRIYGDHHSWTYCCAYLAIRTDVPAAVRQLATAGPDDQRLSEVKIGQRLNQGKPRALMIQNIKDAQGDEIIRTVPLLEALLANNPRLEVTLVTARPYLYAHRRITLVPIDDGKRVRSVLAQRFDVVIDFFETDVWQVNYDLEIKEEIQAYVRERKPLLYLASKKGWNHFVYQRVDLTSRPCAEDLELDRQRVPNVYETTFRLIVELGLPLRFGEDPPRGETVLTGLPCHDADAAWGAVAERNAERRPTALFWPFGGQPLKGYVERAFPELAERVRGLIAEGFYVILQPNGMPWGSVDHVRRVLDRLTPEERAHVAIGPDPTAHAGSVSHRCAGTQPIPYASYIMHLVIYFVRFADLIVTVEGWMMHAAYCLGRSYRVLMLPYSHVDWQPYGRTIRQDVVVEDVSERVGSPEAVVDAALPLAEMPRKHALLFALKGLGRTADAAALPLLRRALRSEDAEVRHVAAESLRSFAGADIEADLLELLDDRSAPVRAAAAGMLLDRAGDPAATAVGRHRDHLRALRWIGQPARDWLSVLRLGEAAIPALRVARDDDDPVVRREAAEILAVVEGRYRRSTERPSLKARIGRSALASRLFLRWPLGGR